jgi:hypothetical protein
VSTRLEKPGRPAIEVTATPCRHGPPLSRPIVGDVIGFALRRSIRWLPIGVEVAFNATTGTDPVIA